MSEPSPFGPTGGGPLDDLMRNLTRLLTAQGPVNWEIARQMAQWGATGGQPEPNPDPVARVRLEELLRVAELQVTAATGLSAAHDGVLTARAVTKAEWALRTLDQWRPTLEKLASSLTEADDDPEADTPADPMSQLIGNLPQVIGPFLFGVQAGSMVGQLATRSFAAYDLPVPRPVRNDLLFVPSTIDTFAQEWSLNADDVRLWVCLHEVTHHAVVSLPHVHDRIDQLIDEYVSAFEPDRAGLEDRLSNFDPSDPTTLQEAFGDPQTLLGDLQSDAQRRIQVPLRTLLSAVTGYVDHVMDSVGQRLIGSYASLTEALRRRRLEDGKGSRALGQLLGIELDAPAYETGRAFVRGVLERAGEDGLALLWHSERELPTPAELQAPGLWLARIELPDSR